MIDNKPYAIIVEDGVVGDILLRQLKDKLEKSGSIDNIKVDYVAGRWDALELVKKHSSQIDIVVTEQIFRYSITGFELADDIYALNNNILTFCDSTWERQPEWRGKFAGYLKQHYNLHKSFIDFVTSPDLSDIIRQKDGELLIKTFPFIEFVPEFRQEHPEYFVK